MPRLQTKFFGELEYNSESVYCFSSGLPGFEEQRNFVFLNVPQREPLLFLQSVPSRNLCFVLLPILVVNPAYRLELTADELILLGLPPDFSPRIGEDLLCAAMLCAGPDGPTANLMAPVVVNLRNRSGLQVIRGDSGYSHQHHLLREEATIPC
jgi:flagellar assembly factor FliW